MNLINWSDTFSVGFHEIDKDHQKLVGILNEFSEAVESKQTRDALEDIFEELIDYTSWHFRHEERLMQEFGYEEMEEHQKIHSDLATNAVTIQSKFENGDDSALDGLIPFLKEWLTTHIQVTDKKLGMFLAAQE